MCFLFETDKIIPSATEVGGSWEVNERATRVLSAYREPIPAPSPSVFRRILESTRFGTGPSTHTPMSLDPRSPTQRPAPYLTADDTLEGVGPIDDRVSSSRAGSRFAQFFSNIGGMVPPDDIWDEIHRLRESAPVGGFIQADYPTYRADWQAPNVRKASNTLRHPVQHVSGDPRLVGERQAKHRWVHGAAVKAIAFCPWREGLVATGGGSHDKCIHFWHTTSGAALATISVHSQVTSLIWSTTRREIAATFGYAQPEHPYRIAVFSWPGCQQVAAIP